MAELTIRLEDNRYKIRAQGLYLEWPAGNADNQKALILFLHSFKKGPGKQHGLFTQGQIAQALPDFAGGTKQRSLSFSCSRGTLYLDFFRLSFHCR